jgi:hypothetical protein
MEKEKGGNTLYESTDFSRYFIQAMQLTHSKEGGELVSYGLYSLCVDTQQK